MARRPRVEARQVNDRAALGSDHALRVAADGRAIEGAPGEDGTELHASGDRTEGGLAPPHAATV